MLHDVPSWLLEEVCRELVRAGFDAHTTPGLPGLYLRLYPDGIIVRWETTEGFSALSDRPRSRKGQGSPTGDPHEGVRGAIHLAVHDLLTQLGYPVVRSSGNGGVLLIGRPL